MGRWNIGSLMLSVRNSIRRLGIESRALGIRGESELRGSAREALELLRAEKAAVVPEEEKVVVLVDGDAVYAYSDPIDLIRELDRRRIPWWDDPEAIGAVLRHDLEEDDAG